MQDTSTPTLIARRIIDNVSRVIVGKRSVVEQALAALVAQGHLLVEDVPGVGKTMLAKSLSTSIGCSFKRIQFTPDLLPSDVSGISIYSQQSGEFQFRPGPIMSQVVLADEINRATPKTQSALLEAMEELQVTVDGVTHLLEHPFIVMATQNPIEYEGTFPLPEAQLDRFLMRISLGYPDFNENVPGVGKTMLAKSLSTSIGCSFKRIQFTPDLLPSDVSGISIYSQQSGEFQFRPGPIMSQVVLADEINRATPKTQSALLEAMEELQVTVDGVTHLLEHPFIVMATQNPIEYEGTFPLPEAQLDRFLMRISLGYPDFNEELSVIEIQETTHPIESLEAVATPQDVIAMQEAAKEIYVDQVVRQYIVSLVEATRQHRDVALGASPRASLGLFRASRAMALVQDRDYVIPDDIKTLADSVIGHRLILSASARMRGMRSADVVDDLLNQVAVPGATR